ncbi:general secretion pathway protein GspB [Thalassotalea mangrovi]|uniref:Type II secretion system protein GspB C-terminal domain-containing protein n=1 Tax=Thalassotalea mangrovi TaxID=2572245 RepID=A0A4U1B948_9GAMM|nr:general secretion pathway protein GspB [Thalassotalea mangrovi]TKB47180.1 hypothetical protein E8M12_02670 [Thalassotalea mangrovi]
MSYILEALKKDPKTQQQLNIDPLRQYHHQSARAPLVSKNLLLSLLALSAFVGSYLFFGGTHWIASTWFSKTPEPEVEEILRASYQSAHPLAAKFDNGDEHNQQLVSWRAEQQQIKLQQQQSQVEAEMQANEERQTQLIAAQIDKAIAKHTLNNQAAGVGQNSQTLANSASSSSQQKSLVTKPVIDLNAQQQDQISPELLAAFNQAIDEAYASEQEKQRIETAVTEVTGRPLNAGADPDNKIDKKNQSGNQVPLLTQLPSRYRNSVPAIQFSLHMYSSDISSRWVRMNGQDYFEGGVSPEGIMVEQIEPQFVILSFQGRAFRLAALSSW